MAADLLWSLGATAVTEGETYLDAGFPEAELECSAAQALAASWDVEVVEAPAGEWEGTWRAHAEPVEVAGVVIRPAWIDGPERHLPSIAVDPGLAFGIGSHPTTRLCIVAMRETIRDGDDVLDVGTGTGVLAMVAVAFGARSVTALDNDAEAVSVARANVRRNGMEARIAVHHRDASDGGSDVDLVVANLGGLLAPIGLARALAAPARRAVIVGGLLEPPAGTTPAPLGPAPLDPALLDPAPLDTVMASLGLEMTGSWVTGGWHARRYGRRG